MRWSSLWPINVRSSKSADHLFWIITLLSKATAAACLRRNLICLSKNTGRDLLFLKNHGKKCDGWRSQAAGDGFEWQPSSIFGLCVYFCWVESSVDYVAPRSERHISHSDRPRGNFTGWKVISTRTLWEFFFFFSCRAHHTFPLLWLSLMKFVIRSKANWDSSADKSNKCLCFGNRLGTHCTYLVQRQRKI